MSKSQAVLSAVALTMVIFTCIIIPVFFDNNETTAPEKVTTDVTEFETEANVGQLLPVYDKDGNIIGYIQNPNE